MIALATTLKKDFLKIFLRLPRAYTIKLFKAVITGSGCHDIQHNDTQHNDTQQNDTQQNDTQQNDTQQNNTQQKNTQQNDTQQNDTQHNDIQIALDTECFYAECQLC